MLNFYDNQRIGSAPKRVCGACAMDVEGRALRVRDTHGAETNPARLCAFLSITQHVLPTSDADERPHLPVAKVAKVAAKAARTHCRTALRSKCYRCCTCTLGRL